MEKLCSRVRSEDADALEGLVKPVRERASAAALDFLLLHSDPPPSVPAAPPVERPSIRRSISCHDLEDEEPVLDWQVQLRLPEIPADQNAAESWDNLEEVRMGATKCLALRFHFSFKPLINTEDMMKLLAQLMNRPQNLVR